MPVTSSAVVLQDWTVVAQNVVGESAPLDISALYHTSLLIQAFLDTTTAHLGTRFIVQLSHHATGGLDDEDWGDFTQFVGLIGTAVTDLIENNPLAQGSTVITLTGHAYTSLAKWMAIEDGTLVDSELVFEVAQGANAITILDGTANAHAQNTAMFNIAFSNSSIAVMVGSGLRLRVLVDNTYDPAGSTLNYRIVYTQVTAI